MLGAGASDDDLVEALEENVVNAHRLIFQSAPGGEVVEVGGLIRATTGIAHPMVNGVLRARLPAEGAVVATRDFFLQRNLPSLWHLGPSSRPANLADQLVALGAVRSHGSPGMIVDLEAFPPPVAVIPSCEILPIVNSAMQEQCCRLVPECFGLPVEVANLFLNLANVVGFGDDAPFRTYLAYQHGEPVGMSAVHFSAGVAGIYNVGTVVSARRQGIGAAATATALAFARNKGFSYGALQSSRLGYSVYASLGFREVCQFEAYRFDIQS